MEVSHKKEISDYDLYIFDWDGTLSSLHTFLRVIDTIKRIKRKIFHSTSTKPKRTLVPKIREEEIKNTLTAVPANLLVLFSRPKLHNDVREILELLEKRGKHMAIFTNAASYRIGYELDRLGLKRHFDTVISAYSILAPKPNPLGIEMIIKKYKKNKRRVLYIGDSIDDILAAKLAGIDSCAVSGGFDSYIKLKSVKPKFIFKSIEEMFIALK